MVTPLFRSLKSNGTSFYAFANSSFDVTKQYNNSNFTMNFSKFALLNMPKQNLSPGTNSTPIQFDFDTAFETSINYTTPPTYAEQLVESLRNYVANEEVTIRDAQLNNTEYFYDDTTLQTPTERIFFKWAKELNLIDFEPAIDGDQYFGNLSKFQSNNLNDPSYFPQILWQERQVIAWQTISYNQSAISGYTTNLQVNFAGTTNFVVGDTVTFNNVSNTLILNNVFTNNSGLDLNGANIQILYVQPAGLTQGQSIVVNLISTLSYTIEQTGTATLLYNKLVQYIGEISGVNNVNQAGNSYTEIHAQVPAQNGATPDVLFATVFDDNYGPGFTYPILPSQYQPEIIGAELSNSPIVTNPGNYPGSYWGQFDTIDFTYLTQPGDILRYSGNYFGMSGSVTNPTITGSTIDGITLDFNTSDYVKMNIIGSELTNFDQFDALEVNNNPPSDFQFNAILWYYEVQDNNGNTALNLYGISFLDNPANDPIYPGLRVPQYNKMTATNTQDGTSFAFSLTLNFNTINENPQDAYNPNAINSLFSMNLFNQAMTQLGAANDAFIQLIANYQNLVTMIQNLQGLVYTQTDIQTINSQISTLNNLLQLYQTLQIVSSDTITVTVNNNSSPPTLTLDSIDTSYYSVDGINATDLYNANGVIPMNIDVPDNKDFLVYVTNNDENNAPLPNGSTSSLTIFIDQDLNYLQTVDIIVNATTTATQNKQLSILINYQQGPITNLPVLTPIVSGINLPVFYNSITQGQNSAALLDDFSFTIDTTQPITLNLGGILSVPLAQNNNLVYNSINSGDTLVLNNFIVGTSSQYNFSGQYVVQSVSATNSYINLNVSNNLLLLNYGASASLPLTFNSNSNYLLSNQPYFILNQGYKVKITRVDNTSSSDLNSRYLIETDFVSLVPES